MERLFLGVLDMHANRNKKAIKRVEKGMMKANRIRNTFAVLAVVLTTFMITTVFSLGINYMQNMQLSSIRTAGTSADVTLNMPTSEQEHKIRSLDYVETVGTQYMVGSAVNVNSEDRESTIAIQYYDETEWEHHYKEAISDIHGSYPTKENEIMLSEDALKQLGITEPTLQMEIPLSYFDKNGEQQKNFSLSGWFHSYVGTRMAFVSETYCTNSGYNMQEDGILSLSLNDLPGDFYQLQDDIILNDNQSLNGSFSISSSDGSLIFMVILLVLFIIGSGYLLIYNVLYISISKDTRFYGLIKTIGTTQKQIKTLVKKQAFKFACIGIPIGTLLAAAVSFGIVPLVLQRGFEQGKSSMDVVVFFHPSIFILSIFFSAVTVWLACNAPAKAAAKISPVEALRFQNFTPKKEKNRNSTNGGKLHVMAFHNVFRDKKRAMLVFLSLFMGIVTILGVNGILGSINGENFIDRYMKYDFRYTDIQYTQYENLEKEVPQFDEHLVEQISEIEGVENVSTSKITWAEIGFKPSEFELYLQMQHDEIYQDEKSYEQMISELQEYADRGEYGSYVVTLDESLIEQYNDTHNNTSIDIDSFKKGDTVIVGMDTEVFTPHATMVGKTLHLTSDNVDGQSADFEVAGAFNYNDIDDSFNIGHRKWIGAVPDVIYVSDAGMERLTKTATIYDIGVDIENSDQMHTIHNELLAINETLPTGEWDFQSSVDQLDYFNQMYYSIGLIGNGAAILLIVIGLMNFINVMLTGVIARKYELAIMESIGTTKKQIGKILTIEGGYYALITTVLIMTLGNAFLLLVAAAVPSIADYAKFEYPIAFVIGLIVAIFVICLSVPSLVYRFISKETVIERLHDFEN